MQIPPPLLHAVDVSPYVINLDWLQWRAQEIDKADAKKFVEALAPHVDLPPHWIDNGGPRATYTKAAFAQAVTEATRSVVERNAAVFEGREFETVPLSSSPSSPYIVKIKRK